MNKSIGWGFWGTGKISHEVASDIRLVKGAALSAVASRTSQRAERFAARHEVAKWYDSLDALIEDENVDIVYVATPNYRHADDSLAVLQAGKAVLCEKPFALSLSQAQQVVNVAREHKIFCMEAMWTRFIPAVKRVKVWIESGAIGPVRFIQGNFSYPVAELRSSVFDRELGGGALLDRGVYLISLAQQLLGMPQSVRGTACIGDTGVDDQSAYQLAYSSGALADFAASLRARGTNEFLIVGERGLLRLCDPFYRAHRVVLQSFPAARATLLEDLPPSRPEARKIMATVRDAPAAQLLLRWLDPVRDLLQRSRARSFPFAGHGYQFELLHVGECLREQRIESPIMPLDDSLQVMRIMDELGSQLGLAQLATVRSDSD